MQACSLSLGALSIRAESLDIIRRKHKVQHMNRPLKFRKGQFMCCAFRIEAGLGGKVLKPRHHVLS